LCGLKCLPSKVHPGMVQARPQGAPGAPLGAPWALGQPWDSAGVPERRGLREGAPWQGQGSHCQPMPHTGAVQLRPQGAPLAPSSTRQRAHSSAKPKCACKAVDIYIFASLSGLQSRHGLHRQLLQHAATEASMCACARPLTPSWWMKCAPASEHRRATSKHRLRPLPGCPLEVVVVGQAATTADVYGASSTHATSESRAGRCLYAITKAKLICASWRSVH
jgi:hypothetical protein